MCLCAGLRRCHNSIRQTETRYSRTRTTKVTELWRWMGAFAQKNIWFGYKYHIMKEQHSRVRGKEHENQRRWKTFIIVTIRYGVWNSDQQHSAVSSALYPLCSLFGLSYNEYYVFVEGSRGLEEVRLIIGWLCIKAEEVKIPICVFSKL